MAQKILLVISAFVVLLVIVGLILFSSKKSKSPTPIPSAAPTSSATSTPVKANPIIFNVVTVDPADGSLLNAGQKQKFNITFDQPIQTNWVTVQLTAKNTTSDQSSPTTVNYTESMASDSRTLTISSSETIGPNFDYELVVKNATNSNLTLLDAHYTAGEPAPSPAANNNPALQQYLPYETQNYLLSYSKEQNVYVFNFKYDPNSSVDLNTQYDQAKDEATRFIQSKGIDVNSIVIQWRHS
jgi:methionine-rich copper-binding protein CopC